MQQELFTLPEHLSSPPVFSRVRVTRSLVLYVVCRSLYFPLSFLFCPSFDIRILITLLVSSNSSCLSFCFFPTSLWCLIENNFLSSDETSYFIGATDIGSEGHWRWLNNENKNYFKFAGSQPNNYDNDFPTTYPANCGRLGGCSKNAGIYDDYCYRKRQYSCWSS